MRKKEDVLHLLQECIVFCLRKLINTSAALVSFIDSNACHHSTLSDKEPHVTLKQKYLHLLTLNINQTFSILSTSL